MKRLKDTLAAIGILFFVSCGGSKDYYMFTSFHEPADEGLRYLYSEDGMHWDSIPGIWLKPELGSTINCCGTLRWYVLPTELFIWSDDKLERRSRVRLCKLQRPDSLVKATDDTCHDRRTDHGQCMGSGDFL